MTKKVLIKTYFDEETAHILKSMDNTSDYIRQIVHKELNQTATLDLRLIELDKKERELRKELTEIQRERTELQQLKTMMKERRQESE